MLIRSDIIESKLFVTWGSQVLSLDLGQTVDKLTFNSENFSHRIQRMIYTEKAIYDNLMLIAFALDGKANSGLSVSNVV